jgi:hypothetical protein
VSFGPKLDPLPTVYLPGEQIIVALEFVAEGEEFERELEVFVEEPKGVRPIRIAVKNAPREPLP